MAGIRDKVAIIGMGCSKFGERWDASPDDLMLEAYTEALADANIAKEDIQMAWLGVFFDEQPPEANVEAVDRFERHRDEISSDDCRRNARRFRPAAFRQTFAEFVWETARAAGSADRRQARSHPFEPTRIVARPASSSAHGALARASHRADL